MLWLTLALAAIPTIPTHSLASYGVGDGSAGSVTLTPTTPVSGPAYGRLPSDVAYLDTELDLVDAGGFSAGDLVLDNRFSEIKPWKKTDLTWIMMQSQKSPRIWVKIGPSNDRPTFVANQW